MNSTTGNFIFNSTLAGKVGINDTTPAAALDVAGAVRIGGYQATHSPGLSLEWNKNSDLSSYILNTGFFGTPGNIILGNVDANNNITAGKIGIGQVTPNAALDVNGNIQISNATIPMGLMTEVGGTTPLLDFDMNFRETNKNTTYLGSAFRLDSRGGANNPFQWMTRAAGSTTENTPMVLSAAGNLGIGTTSPQATLDVHGTVNIAAWASQSIGPNGYANIGGLLIEWGSGPYTSNAEVSVNFPKGFNNVFAITCTVNDSGSGGGNVAAKVFGNSNTSFNYAGTGTFSGGSCTVSWIAIGN